MKILGHEFSDKIVLLINEVNSLRPGYDVTFEQVREIRSDGRAGHMFDEKTMKNTILLRPDDMEESIVAHELEHVLLERNGFLRASFNPLLSMNHPVVSTIGTLDNKLQHIIIYSDLINKGFDVKPMMEKYAKNLLTNVKTQKYEKFSDAISPAFEIFEALTCFREYKNLFVDRITNDFSYPLKVAQQMVGLLGSDYFLHIGKPSKYHSYFIRLMNFIDSNLKKEGIDSGIKFLVAVKPAIFSIIELKQKANKNLVIYIDSVKSNHIAVSTLHTVKENEACIGFFNLAIPFQREEVLNNYNNLDTDKFLAYAGIRYQAT